MKPTTDTWFDERDQWREGALELRTIMLDCGLGEALKWRKPCYTFDDDNIAIIQPMNDFLALMFFKGALLDDPDSVLQSQGKNTRSARRLCFTSVEQVLDAEETLRALVREAIRVARAGLEVPKKPLVLVDELQHRLDADPALAAAFDALTPGRQRGYNIYISGAKQSETRERRIDQCEPKILAGKGLRDR